jgi:hypothetical protein
MADQDIEITDIVVVFDECADGSLDDLVAELTKAGVEIENVDRDNNVVEGSIETAKVKPLEKLPHVKYVRGVFNYLSEASDPDAPIPE